MVVEYPSNLLPPIKAKSFHDDYIKENAKFRNDAGLKCFIVRTSDGKCCEWCSKLAGRYDYADAPEMVFHRHDNCGCTTVYENGKYRQDVWTKKSWENPDVKDKRTEPAKLSSEQAVEIERKNLQKYHGLTEKNKGGIIKINMQYFAKKSSDFPTVKLTTNEYAHIMSEIATHISDEQKNRVVFKKAIGNYMYTIENNGFGNYRIIGRRKLK